MINRTDDSKLMRNETQANLTGDLKYFLLPFFTFRVHVHFKNPKRKCHFYGNEHECTYQQLKRGHVPHIVMDKIKGYTGLIKLIEHTWKNKITSAGIYMRLPGEEKFDRLCRRWYNGDWEEIQDPVISHEEAVTILYYSFEKNKLQIHTTPPEDIDFKTELTNALNKTTGTSSTDQ